MVESLKYIFLGIVQGLTEFLPVSSSGHLVLFQKLLHIQNNQIILDIILHLGTLVALVVFLGKDLKLLLDKKILAYLVLATVITGTIVILCNDFFESLFVSAKYLPVPLFITGIVLLSTKKVSYGARQIRDLKIKDGLWLGLVQGLAVIPGLSRSGVTISALLFRKVERETAFKFSMLASIFAILGALIFKADEASNIGLLEWKYMFFGFLSAFLVGLLALKILLTVIRRAQFHLFGYYCIILALLLWGWLK